MKHLKTAFIALCLLSCNAIAAQQALDMTGALTDGTYYYRLYSADTALDFAATDGVDAYVVTRKRLAWGTAQSVTLTRVDQVPAQTGVLVRTATAQTYTVAAATSDVTAPEKNNLVAISQDTDVADLYVVSTQELAVNVSPAILSTGSDGQVGFCRVDIGKTLQRDADGHYTIVCNRNERTLEAGTAYMAIDEEGGEMMSSVDIVPFTLLNEPEPMPAADNLQEAKDILEKAEDYDDVLVTFHDAVVTATAPTADGADDTFVVEDATAAMRFFNTGQAAKVKAGDVLNGTVQFFLNYNPLGSALTCGDKTTDSFDRLTITHGTTTPLAVSDDTVEEYIYNYDWRLARFTGANRFKEADGEPYIYLDIIGDDVPVFDLLKRQLPPPPTDRDVEVVGYLFDLFGSYYLQPLDYIVDGVSTAVTILSAPAPLPDVYDLSGRRVSSSRRGIAIQGGRKLMLK
ncbi:MAG: hypothetical protein IJ533_10520 [Prevotella sp.]|nr:hypothetical protein [Prevotella sp.]MBQ8488066.1 hypothetical protein [Prevotella sp.]